jgi:hypothetical protein
LLRELLKQLLVHIQETKQRKKVKTYLNHLADLDQMIFKKLEELEKSVFLTEAIISHSDNYNLTSLHSNLAGLREELLKDAQKALEENPQPLVESKKKGKGRKKKSDPDAKSTYEVTMELLKSGKDIQAIAKERGLAVGTIESHLGVLVGQNKIDIDKFISKKAVDDITEAMQSFPEGFSSADLFSKLKGKYGYGMIRAVMVKRGK